MEEEALLASCRGLVASSFGASCEKVNECSKRAGEKNQKEDCDALVEANAINNHPDPECQEGKEENEDGLEASDP